MKLFGTQKEKVLKEVLGLGHFLVYDGGVMCGGCILFVGRIF